MPSLTVISGVFLVVAVVMLAAAAYRGRRLIRRPRPPDLVALVLTLTMLGLSFALQAPLVRDAQNTILTNLGQLLGNGTTLIAAFAATTMVLFIVEDDETVARRRLRLRLAALLVALTAMTVLFATNPTDAEEFTSPDAPAGIIAYYLVYLIYLAVTLVDLFALVVRRARRAPDSYLRAGMLIVAASCIVGLLYAVGRSVNLTLNYLGFGLAATNTLFGVLEFLVAAVVPAVAVLLLVIGVTFRRWAPTVARPVQWWLRRRSYQRSYRRLEPLWQAVHAVLPELAFKPRDAAARPRLRLYGRVVELHDAELTVVPYVDQQLRADVELAAIESGLSGQEAAAAVDAVVLVAGLQALRDNSTMPEVASRTNDPQPTLSDIDLGRATQRLERMSSAYVSSPLLQQFTRPSMTSNA